MSDVLACDTVVVGGGTAGSVVAGRLAAESDQDVIVLEAGPDYGPRSSGRWPDDLLDAAALVTSHSWEYASGDLYPDREPIEFARARVIGGCSSHNGCIAAVGCVEDYEAWAGFGGPGWGPEALRPLFARALARMRVRHYRPEEVWGFHEGALRAAARLGIPLADDLADLDAGIGFGTEPVNVEDGIRLNAAFAYLDPARARPNLQVVDEVLVDRLAEDADGVDVVARRDGREVRVRAARAVLAAGTYGSPAILLRSGIGDPRELARLGIPTRVPLRAVGGNLHDHPLIEVDFEGTTLLAETRAASAATRFTPEEQSIGKLRSSRAQGPYDLHLVPVAAHPQSLLAGRVLIAVGALEPRSRGRLTLRSADPAVAPVLDHGYLSDSDDHDRAVLCEGVELARELAACTELGRFVGRETGALGPDVADSVRRIHGHYYHPVGTCRLGPEDDSDAVCDGRARVRGTERVHVADCSLMPIVPRANTNIPAIVVGERVSDLLLAG